MATLLALCRRRGGGGAAFFVGAALKLSPYLATTAYAQNELRTDLVKIGGVTAVNMPYICDSSTGVSSTVINIGTTQAQVVAGSTKSVYVCGYQLTTADSTTLWKWVEGTSPDCITGQADKSGTFNASSKWGISVPNGGAVQFKTSSGASLCIDTTSTGVYGILTYISST